MHEVAAMRGAVSTVLEQLHCAGGSRVTSVDLVLGASGHLSEDAARQYWELFTRDTAAQDATVSITWAPATFQCFSCLHQFKSTEPAAEVACPACGGVALEIAHEDVCAVRSLDVAFDESDGAQSGDARVLVIP
jgi:hydrogenase nickel incorporation protein HypA/HybF